MQPMRDFDQPLIALSQRRERVGMSQQSIDLLAAAGRGAPFFPESGQGFEHTVSCTAHRR